MCSCRFVEGTMTIGSVRSPFLGRVHHPTHPHIFLSNLVSGLSVRRNNLWCFHFVVPLYQFVNLLTFCGALSITLGVDICLSTTSQALFCASWGFSIALSGCQLAGQWQEALLLLEQMRPAWYHRFQGAKSLPSIHEIKIVWALVESFWNRVRSPNVEGFLCCLRVGDPSWKLWAKQKPCCDRSRFKTFPSHLGKLNPYKLPGHLRGGEKLLLTV